MMTKMKEMTELHYPQLQTYHCSNTQMQRLMYVQKLSNGSWITKIFIVGNPPSVLNMLAVRPWANSLCFSCSCSVLFTLSWMKRHQSYPCLPMHLLTTVTAYFSYKHDCCFHMLKSKDFHFIISDLEKSIFMKMAKICWSGQQSVSMSWDWPWV